ncbi:MAG: O-antigen ligase family protein [Alphaproteobacteria bacterium]
MLGIGVYLGIVGTLLAWCFARPSVVLSMVFLLFALDQWGSALAGGIIPSGAFTNYLAAGMTALGVILLFIFGRPQRFLGGTAFWLVLAIYVYAFVSTFWVPVPDKAAVQWLANSPYLVVFLVAAPLLVQEIDDLEEPLRALLLLGTPFIFCLNFLLEWGYRGFIVNGEVVRLPLALAQFGGYIMIVGALFGPKHSYWILLRLAAVLLGALLIIKTGARGQFISAFVCCAVMFGIGRSNFSPIRLLLISVAGVIFLGIAYFGAISYMKSDPALKATAGRWSIDRLFEDYGERSIRVVRIEAMLAAWQDSPGTMLIGLGNSAAYDPDITGCTSPIGCYPHNLVVEVLTEEGLVGLGLFVALFLYVGVTAIRAISDPTLNDEHKNALKVMFAFMVFELILSLKQSSLLGNWGLFLFAILVDRAVNLVYQPVNEIALAPPPPRDMVRERTQAWLAQRKTNRGIGRRAPS